MTQIAIFLLSAFFLGYFAGCIRTNAKWRGGGVRRVKSDGYYWVISDKDEAAKRFLGSAFSAKAQWVDSTDYNMGPITALEAQSIVSLALNASPVHRFANTLGWQIEDKVWLTLSHLELGDYMLALWHDDVILATATARGSGLRSAVKWIKKFVEPSMLPLEPRRVRLEHEVISKKFYF